MFLLCGSTDLLRTVSCLSLGIIVKNSSLLSFHLSQAFIVLVRFLLGRCYCFVISPVTEFYLGKSNKCHLLSTWGLRPIHGVFSLIVGSKVLIRGR